MTATRSSLTASTLAGDATVDLGQAPADLGPAEPRRRRLCDPAAVPAAGMVQRRRDRVRDRARVARAGENARAVVHDFRNTADGGRDRRQPARHRLDEHARIVVVAAREDEERRFAHAAGDLRLRHDSVEDDMPVETEVVREAGVRGTLRTVADDVELDVATLAPQQCDGFEEVLVALRLV